MNALILRVVFGAVLAVIALRWWQLSRKLRDTTPPPLRLTPPAARHPDRGYELTGREKTAFAAIEEQMLGDAGLAILDRSEGDNP